MKWNNCSPSDPDTAKSLPEGDIQESVAKVVVPPVGTTAVFGMFRYVLLVVRFPELSAVYTASCVDPWLRPCPPCSGVMGIAM